MTTHGFTRLPDLASRALAASVVYANDELFAERENLIKPESSVFSTEDFGHKGKVYDGWETRRRREPGNDHAIVRLGVPGVVHGVVIDTAWFKGNYPPYASVEATSVEGAPSPAELERASWETIVGKSAIKGDTENAFEVADRRRWTHVRLSIYPDGGVARFRVHGEPVPDPRFMDGTIDLAALEHGGAVVDCSNTFYSAPVQLLLPGRARIMGDGWENARRRDGGNDHVTIRLAARGRIRRVEIDTSYFVGNAAGWASLRGIDGDHLDEDAEWFDLVPKTRLQPDTRHFFRSASAAPVTHVRLDVFPDGGLARLRVHGEVVADAHHGAVLRWLDLLPAEHAVQVLGGAGVLPETAEDLLRRRPFAVGGVLPSTVLSTLSGGLRPAGLTGVLTSETG
ncbi:allantoicase [Streptosporangium canum]|uniref:allantoicase n=1 Tax=Streptosporangium canum TaxID=324952 RepID=UPI003426353A